MTTYRVKIYCDNCKQAEDIEIEFGKTIAETPCPFCGCTSIKIYGDYKISDKANELLRIFNQVNTAGMSLRKIGKFIKSDSPQVVKHYITKLVNDGLLVKIKDKYTPTSKGKIEW